MLKRIILILITFLYSCGQILNKDEKPNFVFILADDLGYGELGVFGQKIIETPFIDQLAREGMILTDHYSGSPVCAPARAVLMTGLHTGNSPIRGNGEWKERGDVWSFKAMFDDPNLEGQRPMPDSIITVASFLQSQGYKTGMTGKWGLGAPNTNSVPNKMGFDFFYGYNCQRQAHTLYPSHLWKNGERDILNNKIVNKGKLSKGLDPYMEESYQDYNQNDYAPTLMHNEALGFLDRNKNNNFFLYYASPIPHLPLQAPLKWVNYYREKFGNEEPYLGDDGYYPNISPMATYAAMISYLDQQVGDIVSKLKEIGQYENTLIIFTSDNGPTFKDQVDIEFFNSTGIFVNSKTTVKGSVNEGGLRVPSIASWPKKIKPGSKSDYPMTFYDYFATVSDILGEAPTNKIDGNSYYPSLMGEKQKMSTHLYWEFPAQGGQQAIRIDHWKGIRKNLFKGLSKIQLYNLKDDPKELIDLAEIHPEVIEKMKRLMNESHSKPEIKEFIIPVLDN